MSISYSGIVNYGKATLPSVEAGLGSMNILRDPPKSIHTRRIDKVGETSSITELIDTSGNRSCEVISLYARGINPSVSVDYGNAGNNGGQRVSGGGMVNVGSTIGSSGNSMHGGQAYLPYRIVRDGAFRPPVVSPFNLLPLSRMPRVNTTARAQPGFVDFSKKLMCPGGNYKEVKEKTIKASIRPTATYKISTQAVEPFEVKYVIKNPVKFDGRAGISGVKTQDITNQINNTPVKEINTTPLATYVNINQGSKETEKHLDNSKFDTGRYLQDTLNSDVITNQGSGETVRYIDNSTVDTGRYLQDTLHSSIQSKRSQSIQITPIEDIMDVDVRTKDQMNISYTPLKTGNTNENHIHKDIELQKRVLTSTVAVNKHRNIYTKPGVQHQNEQKRNRPIATAMSNHGTIHRQNGLDLNSREYTLKPTISVGGMTGRGKMPLQTRSEDVYLGDTNNTVMNKKVMEMQMGRFN